MINVNIQYCYFFGNQMNKNIDKLELRMVKKYKRLLEGNS